MKPWPKYPVIYEINTWVWLQELSRKYGSPVRLAGIPREEWEGIADWKVDAVWFMGIWERSPDGLRIAMRNEELLADFRRALPDFSEKDNVGSPYCVRRYVVDQNLGGPEGLAEARRALADRGIRLILDFVPNHVAPDHPWVTEHPEYFIQGDAGDVQRDPNSFVSIGGKVFACGRDPFFPAWPDVLQLNAFNPGLRRAVNETVSRIAGQCDGVRCDMAMLMMNTIFERTWGPRAGARPLNEYWPELIQAIKGNHPDFLFLAEAYWDLEWELQQQGFDYCYDKKLYDRLEHEPAETIRLHLCADPVYQDKLVLFIENHDEPRAAATFIPAKERAAAVILATLPGAKLLHEGQFEGRKVRLPVFLGRRPVEAVDAGLQIFYQRLLKAISTEALRDGKWRLCERRGWPDNQSCLNILAWCWVKDDERYLIVIHLGEGSAQALVQVPWDDLSGKTWQLIDVLSDETFDRRGDEMRDDGLYVGLGPWGFHFLRLHA
jgi:hypothetical protein